MMFTSGGQAGDAARCRTLGVSAFLTKPVSLRTLQQVVLQILSGSTNRSASSSSTASKEVDAMPAAPHSAPKSADRAPLRVLLVEDNVVNQKMTVTMLSKRGHQVSVAGDGEEALRVLDKERFDVVLMDVHMPKMGGFETTQAIRAREQKSGAHLPIVALTALAMTGDREACLKAGMDGYISKPVTAADLFGTLEKLFPNRGGSATPPAAAPRHRVRADVLDRAKLDQNMEGDEEMLRDIVATFVQDVPQREREVLDALAKGDAPLLARAVHTLKGQLMALAAGPASDAAVRLEILARCGNLAEAEGVVGELQAELAQLLPVLRDLTRDAA